MSSIDNRIVSLTFDNKNFERDIASTLDALDDLSNSLKLTGAGEGLNELGDAVDNINLSNIESALDNISAKFSVMGAIGFAAIQKLTHGAMELVSNISQKALGPLLGGGKLRAENIEQAKFLFRGLGMDVEAGMQSALDAVKGTAYGLDVAAKTAAQFGGSGMQAGAEMTGALRAVAGVAAMTNTSFEEMADVFTSAAGKGKVSGYELQRIGQRGLNAAAALGKVWGKTEQEVRRMATDGEISFKMFAEGMDEAFGEHATKANETYTGSLANMRAALSRMGASFFGPHMLQQRDLFNSLTPAIDKVHEALKPLITTILNLKQLSVNNLIKSIDGFDFTNLTYAGTIVGSALTNAFIAFHGVLKVVKEAFRDIFPKSETSILITLALLIEKITEKLRMSESTLGKVKSIFRGFFASLAIGIEVVRVVANLFRDLFETFAAPRLGGAGGILEFFANIGESLVSLKTSLVDGGGIQKAVGNIVLWFMRMGDYIRNPVEAIDMLRDKLSGLFGGGSGGIGSVPGSEGVSNLMDRIRDRADMLGNAVRGLGNAWGWLSDRFAGIRGALGTIWGWISTWFGELKDKLAAVFTPSDFDPVLDAVNIGLLGGIALMLRKFIQNGFSIDFTGGMLETIKGAFEGLTETLSAMQTELKAKTLKQIAIAIAILTASIVVLSLIDSAALTKALIAISVGMGQLMATLYALEKLQIGTGVARLAASLIVVSTALLILSAAIRSLSGLGWEELAKGLVGIAGGLVVLVVGMNNLNAGQAGMIRAGVAIGIISAALYILSFAVKSFATMSWGEMAKGLVGVYAGLIAIGTAMKFMPEKRMMAQGAALILIATALRILAESVQAFGDIPIGEMLKGLLGIGAALVIIAGAMKLMPGGMVAQGAGLILVATGLRILSEAVEAMGGIAFGELAKGIGAIAVTLGILAIGLNLMVGTTGGAAAVLLASVALYSMAKVVKAFAKMSLEELAVGLGAIAAVFIVLGLSALVLAPVVPVLFSLGAALALIGGAFALFGVGAMLVAKSFEVLAKVGRTSAKVIVDMVKIIIAALPELVNALAMAAIQMGLTFVEAAPVIVKALEVLLVHILESLQEVIPAFVETIAALVLAIMSYFEKVFPKFVETGFAMLMAVLTGFRDNIGEIVTVVADIITGFLDALALKVPELIDSVYNLLMAVFVGVVAKLASIGNLLAPRGGELIGGLLKGIVKNVTKVVLFFNNLPRNIITWIGNVASTLLNKGVDFIAGMLRGLGQKITQVNTFFTSLPRKVVGWVGNVTSTIKSKGVDLIYGLYVGVLEKFRDVRTWFSNLPGAVRGLVGDMGGKLLQAGKDLIQGFLNGIRNAWGSVTSWLSNAASALPGWVTGPLGIRSPSRVFMKIGEQMISGLTVALQKDHTLERSVDNLAHKAINTLKDALSEVPDILDGMDELHPTITPVLDLSLVKATARDIAGLMGSSDISPDVSFSQARRISESTAPNDAEADSDIASGPSEVKFEQNIYSPTPLSVNDIYKNTRNQITLAKEELSVL